MFEGMDNKKLIIIAVVGLVILMIMAGFVKMNADRQNALRKTQVKSTNSVKGIQNKTIELSGIKIQVTDEKSATINATLRNKTSGYIDSQIIKITAIVPKENGTGQATIVIPALAGGEVRGFSTVVSLNLNGVTELKIVE